MKIELTQADKLIDRGNAIISHKQKTWRKGLKRSYLKLQCDLKEQGKLKKMYSTEDHFDGLRVTHQLAGNNVELTVVRTVVQPRLVEIRALARNECKDLSPVVTTTTQTYSFAAEHGLDESSPFGENIIFRVALQSVGE